ncbi:MAG TPA: peptidoglycan-binding domain-containing protein [Candidatus Paceibacterota bacterium]|nr:peptidoglycan-binding domain-containing protein [Candidatus Paceibacterota bacterium]
MKAVSAIFALFLTFAALTFFADRSGVFKKIAGSAAQNAQVVLSISVINPAVPEVLPPAPPAQSASPGNGPAAVLAGTVDVSTTSHAIIPQAAASQPASAAPTSAASPVTTAPVIFSRNLVPGVQGSDVRALQQFLNAHGFTVAKTGPGSPGYETNVFGAKTKAALAAFQAQYETEIGFTGSAPGTLGPKTRAFIGSNFASTPPPPQNVTASTNSATSSTVNGASAAVPQNQPVSALPSTTYPNLQRTSDSFSRLLIRAHINPLDTSLSVTQVDRCASLVYRPRWELYPVVECVQ